MSKKRVVVTGMGAVTPFGVGVDKLWKGISNGKSAVSLTSNYELDKSNTTFISAEAKDFNPADYLESKEVKRFDRFIQFAIVAADEAIKDSGIKDLDIDSFRIGVMVASAAGGFRTIESNHKIMLTRGMTKCSPFTIPMMIANMASGILAMRYKYNGVNKAVVSACASSLHSIGDAVRSIQHNDADIILAGGTEATICDMGIGGFSAARTLSKRNDEPEKASRPYDCDRDGFVMGEGSGVLVLEDFEHAKARGAKIYAEITGFGQTADAYDLVAPDPTGYPASKAMEFALKDADLMPEDIDYINTHGTSTGLGDIAESQAVAKVFGDLDKNKNLSVSSTKSMIGHLLGAAGAVESIICIGAINNSLVPPTINLDNVDERCANLDYVPNKPRKKEVNAALNNSFGFGGHNASIVIQKVR